MDMECKLFVVLLILSLSVCISASTKNLSASYTITFEFNPKKVIHTTIVNYSMRSWWDFTLVGDVDPIKGTDVDLSTTVYLSTPIFDILYITTGIRRGAINSVTPVKPYLQVTLRF